MKLCVSLAAAVGIFASATILSAQEAVRPLLTVSVKNHSALLKAAAALVNAVEPGKGDTLDKEFRNELGSPDLAGIDANRPWQIALWFKGMGVPPVFATYVPVSDFEAFEKGLLPGKLLRGKQNQNEIVSAGGHAIVIHRNDGNAAIAADDRASVRRWEQSVPKSETHALHLNLGMDDAVRLQVISTLAFGKMMLGQTFSNPQFTNQGGFNPAAMTEMIGLYFQILEGVVKGLDQLHVEADVTAEHIALFKRVTPLADTDLSEWLRPGKGGLEKLVPFLDPEAPITFAARVGAGPGALDFMKKAMRLGFQMQNQAEDEATVQRTDELMKAMLPMAFAGSIRLDDGYRFGGVYEIPGNDAAKVYGQLLDWMNSIMEKQVGKDKMYSSFALKRGVRKIGEIGVDHASIGINMDSPAFQSPQQKEVLERMWPGGKFEVEYALKGNRLHMAAGTTLEKVMTPSNAPQALAVDPETASVGHINIAALMKGTIASNPLLPPQMQAKFKQLDPKGLSIPFKVNVDGQLKSEARIPIKLVSALGQLR